MAVEKIISKDILVIPQGGNGVALQLKNNPVSIVNVEREERIENCDALSAAIAVVSNELSNEMSVRAAADVAIENHISEVSAAVVSVNAYLSGISARSVGNISTHGLQSVVDALSNRISAAGGTSVTSQELSAGLAAVSAQAASAIDVVSGAVVDEASIRSIAINVVSNAASNALSVANAASAAVNVVSQALSNEIFNRLSADNALSVAIDVVSNALSHEVSVRTAASAALEAHASAASAAATSVDGRVTSVNAFLSGISARSVGDVSTHGLQSVIDALSNRISAGGGTGSVTSHELSVVAAALSARIDTASALASTADVHASVASAAATSADGHANTVSARVVSVSAELASLIQIASAAATSADAHANAASAAATSADAHANTVSARVVSVSAELVSLIQIASAAATSADGHANAASAAATSVDGRVTSVNTIISNVSVKSVGGTSVKGLQSVVNALSNRISAIPGGGSANPYSYVSGAQAICANAFTDVSGLCVSVSAGGIYKLEGQVMFSCSAATGNSFTLVFPTMSIAAGQLRAPYLNPVPALSVGYSAITWGNFGTAGSGSALISANFAAGALFDLIIEGVMNVNTTGVVKVQARGSVATATITIVPGSYLKVFKIR